MLNRIRKPAACFLLSLMILNACQDIPLAPVVPEVPEMPSFTSIRGAEQGAAGRLSRCYVYRFTSNGWIGYPVYLKMPAAAFALDGSTLMYTVRIQAKEMAPQAEANCTIPRSPMAVAIANKAFDVQEGARVQTRSRNGQFSHDGTIGTLGCVLDGACLLDTLVVIAEPTNYCSRGECWPRDATTSGGSWGNWESGDSYQGDDAYRDGPGAFLACVSTLAGLMITTASLKPYIAAVYEAAALVDSERRVLDYIQDPYNGASPEMIQLHQYRYEQAQAQYKNAISSLAIAGGVTAGAIGLAVVVCSPGMILPTP